MLKQVILALALGGAIMAGPCMAHAKLQSSSPAKDAHLTEAPKALTLTFNEAAQLAVLKLTGGGKEIPIPVDKDRQGQPIIHVPSARACSGKLHGAMDRRGCG